MKTKHLGVALLVSLLPLSCYYLENADDYPCAEDRSCPIDYAHGGNNNTTRTCFRGRCVGTSACKASESTIGKDTTISNHAVCSPLCSNLQPCPTGLTCSTSFNNGVYDTTVSVCVECTSNDQCGGNCCSLGRCITQIEAQSEGTCQSGSGPGGVSTLACDIIQQNCPNSTDKCTLSGKDSTSAVNACVPTTRSKRLVDSCTRTQLGSDDCSKGLLCTPRPHPSNAATTCHQLCKSSSDCASVSGTACITIGTKGARLEGGTCERKCDVFAASTCGANAFCAIGNAPDDTSGSATCASPPAITGTEQTKPIGSACSTEFDCVRGAGCVKLANTTTLQCAAFCDASHPCASGTCGYPADYPVGLGVCGG